MVQLRVRPSRVAAVALLAVVAVGFLAPDPGSAAAQATDEPGAAGDTVPLVVLDEIVVTGARAATPLRSSVVGIGRIDAVELGRLPAAGFADALRMAPGITLLDFDGTGYDPQLAVRGFYGGGEAEYVVVLLDGKPLNHLQTGLVAWDLVPPVAVRSVEVLRGGASTLWGDAAIGGVINVVTEGAAEESRIDWELEGGGHGALEGGVRLAGAVGTTGRRASVFATGRRQDGYREHAAGKAGTVGGEIDLLAPAQNGSAGAALSLSAMSAWRDIERPGPRSADDLADDRRGIDPVYRFDRTEAWVHRVGVEGGPGGWLSGSLAAELRRGDVVRTLPLAPGFADTKARDLDTRRLLATVRHEGAGPGLTAGDRLLVGVDASVGGIDSDYYEVVSGPPEAYAEASGERGALDARDEASRRAAAAFVQYETSPADALRLSLGARVDWLRDHHQPRPVEGASAEARTRSHRAVSPRAGLNVRYLASARHRGHLYLTAGRSFKAPTLDQLFDQRSIPVPSPPFSATTSNPDLDPQYGTQLEAGAYHRTALADEVAAGLSVSVYRMDMEDELDFDVQSLRYVNIGRSRHEGLEVGLEVSTPAETRAFVNWTVQAATQERGEHAGRRLKAIPEHFVAAGVSTRPVGDLNLGLSLTRASGVWLDDANTIPLDAYTRVDARLGWSVAGRTVYVEARNLFDRRYSTTGFPDPSGADVVYYHPAAGRSLSIGIRSGR